MKNWKRVVYWSHCRVDWKVSKSSHWTESILLQQKEWPL